MTAPELSEHEGSWVVTLKNGFPHKTFARDVADRCAKAGLRVETISAYLARINAAARTAS
jgi:hypothetical protein